MKSFLKRIARTIFAILLVAAIVIAVEYFGGQPMGLFAGSRPTQLGYANGKFAPPSWKPNCVSSTVAKDDTHYIEPLAFSGAPDTAWQKLQSVLKATARVKIISDGPAYIHAEFTSAGLGFVDDVEFARDENTAVIHVRSASRLGIRDFNVNRKRIESLRQQWAQ